MGTQAQDFGLIRSLLQEPGTLSWRRICGMLDRYWMQWDSPFVYDQLVPYLEQSLQRWPRDLLRYAQHSWLHDTMSGRSVPQLQFATAMHFVSQELSEARLERLARSMYLRNMRRVDFERGFDQDRIFGLLSAKHMGELEWLGLTGIRLEPDALALFLESCPHVRHLDVSSTHPRVLDCLMQASMPRLEKVVMQHNNISSFELKYWADACSYPGLQVVDARYNRVRKADAKAIKKMEGWGHVQVLTS